MSSKLAYEELTARFHRIAVIGDALGILHWDQATIMPDGSAPARAEQLRNFKRVGARTAHRTRDR